jgi:hypothetical protein
VSRGEGCGGTGRGLRGAWQSRSLVGAGEK